MFSVILRLGWNRPPFMIKIIMDTRDPDTLSLDSCMNNEVNELPTSFLGELENNLSVLNINIRGLKSNFGVMKSFLARVRVPPRLIIVTETHLDDESACLYDLNGYQRAQVNRSCLGGGVLTYVHNSLDFTVTTEYSGIFPTHEGMFITIKCPNNIKVNILSVYRPPNCNLAAFVGYLKSIPRRYLNKRFILGGDLNACPFRDANLTGFKAMQQFFLQHNYRQLVQFPTFFSYCSNPSTLDHIWTNIQSTSTCNVFRTPLADHIPSLTCFNILTRLPDVVHNFRNFSYENKVTFTENIEEKFYSFTEELFRRILRIDTKFDFLSEWLTALCNYFFPIKKKKVSHKRFFSPWITCRILKLIRKKRKLFNLFRKKKITYRSYADYCKGLKFLLFIAESDYHKQRFNSLKHDLKKKWRHLNSILGRDQSTQISELIINNSTVSDRNMMAAGLNVFFKETPIKLQGGLPRPDSDFGLAIEYNDTHLDRKSVV